MRDFVFLVPLNELMTLWSQGRQHFELMCTFSVSVSLGTVCILDGSREEPDILGALTGSCHLVGFYLKIVDQPIFIVGMTGCGFFSTLVLL